jgi:predicted ATPase/DNA-binding CsgD family transcriptional regulator
MSDDWRGDTKPLMAEPLTRRELDILNLLVENLSNNQIAEKLTLAPSSVKWYIKQIFAKMGINDRSQAAARAIEFGLLNKDMPVSAPKHNLPASLAPFIGRQSQVEQVKRMVTDHTLRLITLTGAGGVGKTRLALKVAEASLNSFKHGVWLVELASLNEPLLVDQTVASVFGLRGNDDRSPVAMLQDYLRERNLLLILDNCEHLIEPCARPSDSLLRSCPGLNILVTSREALGVEGEIPFSVPSLTFPDPRRLPPTDSLFQFEVLHLFVERTRSTVPDFAITRENAYDIARIRNRMEESFQLLVGGFHTALPRHQTMRASIDWSYQLLSDQERVLL